MLGRARWWQRSLLPVCACFALRAAVHRARACACALCRQPTHPPFVSFCCHAQVLIKKQQEQQLLQPAAAQQKQQAKQQAKQQRSFAARLKLQQQEQLVASRRPQGSPAACLSLALPAPGWLQQ